MNIEPTSQDIELFNRLVDIPKKQHIAPAHYRSCVILKPWGYEFEMFDDRMHAMWMLCIKPGQATSMHCHQYKFACFIPVRGEVSIRSLTEKWVIGSPQSMSASPKAFHSIGNETDSDVFMLEIETPTGKQDLIRAEDGYGRFREGYEGETSIIRENDLSPYHHVHFGEDEVVEIFDHQIMVTPAGFSIRSKVDA